MVDRFNQSWYHGKINREQTEFILTGKTPGTFLVRDSKSLQGDYVLAVSEGGKVSHYIINHKGTYYQIGDQTFETLPEIIDFYKKHLLDKTTLKEPVEKPEQLQAIYNFESEDTEDLPFKKGDILTLVKKIEENWWRARNQSGREGMIPRNYVQMVQTPGDEQSIPRVSQDKPKNDGFEYAVAIMDHIKVYDDDLLSFNKGDVIKIIKKHEDGSWFGEAKNKTGKFSFTYVRLLQQKEKNGL